MLLSTIRRGTALKLKRSNCNDEIQYDELLSEMRTTLGDIKVGAERTAEIVVGLRNFSRTDEQDSRYCLAALG